MASTTSPLPTAALPPYTALTTSTYPPKLVPGAIAAAVGILSVVLCLCCLLQPFREKPVFRPDIDDCMDITGDTDNKRPRHSLMNKKPYMQPKSDVFIAGPPYGSAFELTPTKRSRNLSHIQTPPQHTQQSNPHPQHDNAQDPSQKPPTSPSGLRRKPYWQTNNSSSWTDPLMLRPYRPNHPAPSDIDNTYSRPSGSGASSMHHSYSFASTQPSGSEATANLGFGEMSERGYRLDIGSAYEEFRGVEGSEISGAVSDRRISRDPY